MRTLSISTRQNMGNNVWALGLLMALCFFVNPVNAQNTERTITGVVSSLDGPLLGATIVLKGTTIGVTSNDSGAFTFPKKLKENDILVVSYLGYKSTEITINRVTAYIEPFLEDNPVILYSTMRTSAPTGAPKK